jgi:photosystem II stability/assembly factor-like uncharacterized protein
MRLRIQILLAVLPALAASAGAASPSPLHATSLPWTALGPFGGLVYSVTADPVQPGILYALTSSGVFKSVDSGGSWSTIYLPGAVGNLAVDPLHPSNLYLANALGGPPLLKSTDGGAHWSTASHGLPALNVQRVVVDPARPRRLYLGAFGGGIWRSDDAGASWSPANDGLPDGARTTVWSISAAFRPAGKILAATPKGVYQSTDAGASWTLERNGLRADPARTVAFAPSDPRIVYAFFDTTGLFRSTDGGASWRPGGASTLNPLFSLAVSPRSPRTLYLDFGQGSIYRSMDGGVHWTHLTATFLSKSLAVDAASPATVYAGVVFGGLGGVLRSDDGGVTWTRRNQGLSAIGTSAFAVDPVDPDRLWTASFLSGNRGKRWVPFHAPDPILQLAVGASSEVFAVLFYQTHGFLQQSLWKTADDGASWSPVDLGVDVALVRAAPSSPSTLYALNASSLSGWSFYRSMDNGQAWEVRSRQTLLDCGIGDLAVAPSASEVVYLAGCKFSSPARSAVLRSSDGGATWTAAATGLPGQLAAKLAVDPHDPDIVYVAVGLDNSPGGPGDGVWKSTDGGASWTRAGNALAGKTVTAVVSSPVSGVVWAAVEGGRIFRSGDGGATWQDRTGGLQAFQVYRLEIDPADPRRVYAATSGGIWTLEDAP